MERIKERIKAAAARGALAHSWIIAGDDADRAVELAVYLTAALLCEGDEPPCGNCRNCRKIFEGIHPDVVTVGGSDQTVITVDEARKVRKEAYIKPNEASGKVFILRNAETMNLNAANALLKVIEEPPAGVSFIFTTVAPDVLPATIRSRCETVNLVPGTAEREKSPLAAQFLDLLTGDRETEAAAFAVTNEKLPRKELEPMLEDMRALAVQRAACADREPALRLLTAAGAVVRAQTYAASNVGAGNVFSYIAAAVYSGEE